MKRALSPLPLSTLAPLLVCLILLCISPATAQDHTLQVLFMGDNGHHTPQRRFLELAPALEDRGVQLHYTQQMEKLNADDLSKFDGLLLYANIDQISDDQAQAVLDFVAGGKGFIPLHCASFCWRNNADMVALMGGQFQRHGGQVFSTEIEAANHPIMEGFGGFSSWDETYIHHKHNEANRTVLEYRAMGEQADGKDREPWTWVRTHGKGRVFYTAWGHDQRTFQQPGFHNLVERGIRWACGDDPAKVPDFISERFVAPKMKPLRSDLQKFEFVDVGPKIPNYLPAKSWGTQGKPRTLMQQPLPPEESMKHFTTPEGFDVKLYADEDDFIAKPIAMTWDERGRLWICETMDYPNELGKARDRIRICEDTDNDHVADKFTVFAEGLSIPTAIVIYRGGAVVQNGTETLYLADTNGDDVADERTVLMSGFAIDDTHGGVSNFRYGLDNWIWAMQGYNNSTPKYGNAVSQSFKQGFWRFKLSQSDPPIVTDVEFVRSSDNNTWGIGISEEGLIFGSTANGNPSMFMPIPNRYYEKVRGWAPATLHSIADTHKFKPATDNVRQVDWHGGYTAGAGHALYTARAFPRQWWNRTAFVCGPTGHLVGTFLLQRNGANYTSSSPLNLLASDDQWSAPIMAEVGPDGAVWVLDWYNYIVQHNPTPNGFERGNGNAYVSDLRDKRHGRIYRVVPDDESRIHPWTSLADATDLQLVETLRHPSMRWRLQAQRLLIQRGAGTAPGVVNALKALVADQSVDEIGLNVGAIHALQTLSGMGKFLRARGPRVKIGEIENSETLMTALKHPSAGVRRNAIAALPNDIGGEALLRNNGNLFSDDDVQVRLQAFLALSDMSFSGWPAKLLVEAGNSETDPVLVDAITSAATSHFHFFMLRAARTDKPSKSLRLICERVAEGITRSSGQAGASRRVGALAPIVNSLADADPAMSSSILDGLIRGLPNNFSAKASDRLHDALKKSFAASNAKNKTKLVQLATKIGYSTLDSEVNALVESTAAVLANEDADQNQRLDAARDLIGFKANDSAVVATILESITPRTSPEMATGLLEVVRRSQSNDAGKIILESAANFSPAVKSAAIGALLSKTTWSNSLLDAAAAKSFDLDELSLEQKQLLRNLPDEALKAKAEQLLAIGGGLPDPDRDAVLKSLLHVTQRSGNVENGKAIYKKVCANCHIHGDTGQQIGPTLTGMATHPKDELLTHILDPSRSVEGNYRLYKVLKTDGQFISGMLAGESKTSITIVDSDAKKYDVAREDIDEFAPSRKSVMPEGFEKQITEKELADLLEFLTDTGPFVPIPLDDFATAISTKGLFHQGDNGPDRMVFDNWEPKLVDGVPFLLTDPQGKSKKNIILLHGPNGSLPPSMPKSIAIPCGCAASDIHLLSGVGGWSHPFSTDKTVSMTVRLTYADGTNEEHKLINGVHFADYIRRVDVPGSKFAFDLNGQQIRYLSIKPKQSQAIKTIELVKGNDISSPIVMAMTVEKFVSPASDETTPEQQGSQTPNKSATSDTRSLKAAVGPRYKIGVGVGHQVLKDATNAALVKKHFQILTPENCMKPQGIRPAEDKWRFGNTDAFADFARQNDLEIVGHTLVWAKDDRTDEWMTKEGEANVSRDKLLQRIENHVQTVVGRYADVATMWDVVNEAIGDSNDGLLRDSVYSRTCGMDFIVTAFKAARAADPDALLIYNDYNCHKPGKREKLIELLTKLKAAGAPVDAYGMQGHFELGDDSLGQLRETFDELRKLNIKVVVSELDIDVVKRGKWWAEGGKYRDELKDFDPYAEGVPADIEKKVIEQYVEVFQLFDEYSDLIERVSFWNLHDGESWLNTFPWERVNYPLLFDRDRKPKPAFDAVYDALTKPTDREPSAPKK